jgi:hypothetical protein
MNANTPATLAGFTVTPAPGEAPMLFVDHAVTGRSGHLGHAMFQNRAGELYAFYANCTGNDLGGHSAVGWMEYKVSRDGGATWSPAEHFELSKRFHDAAAGRTLFTEKAMLTDSGAIVLVHLVSDVATTPVWEPYRVPLSSRSSDDGMSWSEPVEIGPERGRAYGATYADGTVYALKFCNDATVDFCGTTDDHVYRLYASHDDGQSFAALSDLPFDTRGRGYGTICARDDGSLIAYIYNKHDEHNADYCISSDGGHSWSAPALAHFARRLRNPQMIAFGGGYFIHGRSGSYGSDEEKGHFVIYHSADGITWDQGTILARREHGHGAYSNSLAVRSPDGRDRLRIQASHAYADHRTNIVSWWLDQP